MISYDLDPSLHAGEPQPQLLDDGFSPRQHGESPEHTGAAATEPEPMLSDKSLF